MATEDQKAQTVAQLAKLQDALSKGQITQRAYEFLRTDLLRAAGQPAEQSPPPGLPTPRPSPAKTQRHVGGSTEAHLLDLQTEIEEIMRLWLKGRNAAQYVQVAHEGRMQHWREAAENGIPAGQYLLGLSYGLGLGVVRSFATAFHWYRKAVERAHPGAQVQMGFCYYWGLGVEQDRAEAVKWYRKAAEQGHVKAQHNLGVCYKRGEGLPRDLAQAVTWFRKAGSQGDADAQYNLGLCYQRGQGVPQDHAEAAKWFRRAAEQGDADAKTRLSEYEARQGKLP